MRRSIRIKKRIAVLLSILLVLTLLPLNAGSVLAREPAFGDVDDDGKVTAADARLALHAAVGITPLAPDSSAFLAADVNETGDLTAADARLILRAAIRLDDPATFPAPHDDLFRYPADEPADVSAAFSLEAEDEGDDRIAVYVYLDNAVGLTTADFELSFDPDVLSYSSKSLGTDANTVQQLHSFITESNTDAASETGIIHGAFGFAQELYDHETYAAEGDAGAEINVEHFQCLKYVFDVLTHDYTETALRLCLKETGGVGVASTADLTVRNPDPPVTVLRGDVDDDGKVTAADARHVMRAAVGLETYEPDSREFFVADVNETGDLTAADARLILRAAIRLDDPATFPAPHDDLFRYPADEPADASAAFSLETEAQDDGQIAVYVYLDNAVGMKSADFVLAFDPAVLSYKNNSLGADAQTVQQIHSFITENNTDAASETGIIHGAFSFVQELYDHETYAAEGDAGAEINVEHFQCLKYVFNVINRDRAETALRLCLKETGGVIVSPSVEITVPLTTEHTHSFGDWTVKIPATCGDAGEEERVCTVCGEVETRPIPATGDHTFGSWVERVPASCIYVGREERVCEVCGEVETRPIPATGVHTFGDWTVKTQATCGDAGEEERVCEVCGEIETRPIPATGDHTFGGWVERVPASCIYVGREERVCEVCGEIETRPIPATGVHTFGDWTVKTQATCGDAGTEERVCSVCGEIETRAIPATGVHTFGDWTVKVPATVDAEGEETRTCSVCGATESRAIPKQEKPDEPVPAIDTDTLQEADGAIYAAPEQTVAALLTAAGEGANLLNADGTEAKPDAALGSGMVLVKPDGTKKTVIVKGDNDGDGRITASDARNALRAAVELESPNAWQKDASLVADGTEITAADARLILRAAVGLEALKLR